jgi:hypothetical protein
MALLPILHMTLLPFIIYQTTIASAIVDPTQGFTPVSLDNSNFVIQKPYDVSVNQRYSCINGVHQFWVYPTDKPFKNDTNTKPRTEIRISVSLIVRYLVKFCLYFEYIKYDFFVVYLKLVCARARV